MRLIFGMFATLFLSLSVVANAAEPLGGKPWEFPPNTSRKWVGAMAGCDNCEVGRARFNALVASLRNSRDKLRAVNIAVNNPHTLKYQLDSRDVWQAPLMSLTRGTGGLCAAEARSSLAARGA